MGKVSTFSQVVTAKAAEAKDKAESYRASNINRERCFILLVIDDQNTDWSKYFRGRKVFGDWDIRVEQAEFRDVLVTASSEGGVSVVLLSRTGNKPPSPFKPDLLLVRQNLKDAGQDFKNILLAFKYSGVSSVNSLRSIYNFQDKPWVYAHLLEVQKKLGQENFPLINQTFYPSHRDMVHKGTYPCVFKIGHAHGGLGKVRVETAASFQDLASVVAVSSNYCTVEEYVEAKYDLHVFKIGDHYRALMRKSLSGNWKTNVGQSILEEVPVKDKYRNWIDQVSEMFGGLSLCSLEAVVGKDGREFIIEVNDCAMGLMGESQEEDRRNIADLVLKQMEVDCKPTSSAPNPPKPGPPDTASRPGSALSSVGSEVGGRGAGKPESGSLRKPSVAEGGAKVGPKGPKPPLPPAPELGGGRGESPEPRVVSRRRRNDSEDSTGSESSTASESSSASSTVRKDTPAKEVVREVQGKEKDSAETAVEGEDTMKNLRTTFAGIFGDIK